VYRPGAASNLSNGHSTGEFVPTTTGNISDSNPHQIPEPLTCWFANLVGVQLGVGGGT
jgi:hypothetical protein